MKVFVIMGNDFPEAVFDNREQAEAFVQKKKSEEAAKSRGPRIYWTAHEFELQSIA